jgi:hypothetical protein
MRPFLLGGLTMLTMLFACGTDNPPGTLMVKPDAFSIATGQMTFITAYMQDGMTASPPPVDASWSVDPEGIVMLTPYQGIQKVMGVAPGQVVITASAFDQTAKVGITVVSP